MPVRNVTTVRKSTDSPIYGDVQLVQGSNVTLTQSGQQITIAASGGGGSANVGTTTIDFGAFPGASDTSVAVTGQSGILSGSIVNAWLSPAATADHSADEHLLETIKVFAGNIVAGTGFTIYAVNTSEINEPVEQLPGVNNAFKANAVPSKRGNLGGIGTRIYGTWTVNWQWS